MSKNRVADWRLSERRFSGRGAEGSHKVFVLWRLVLSHSRSKCYETCLESCGILSSFCDSIFVSIEQESSDWLVFDCKEVRWRKIDFMFWKHSHSPPLRAKRYPIFIVWRTSAYHYNLIFIGQEWRKKIWRKLERNHLDLI